MHNYKIKNRKSYIATFNTPHFLWTEGHAAVIYVTTQAYLSFVEFCSLWHVLGTGSAMMEIVWKKMIWFKSKRLMQVVKPRRDESKNYWNKYLGWNLQERFTADVPCWVSAGLICKVVGVLRTGDAEGKISCPWAGSAYGAEAPQVSLECSWFSEAVTGICV